MPRRSRDSVRHDAAPRDEVLAALARWAAEVRRVRPEVVRIGCFGSYARGDHVPASDLDVLVEVASSPHARWFDRPVDFPPTSQIPVGVELFVYTTEEVERMGARGSGWLRRILSEIVWM